MAIKSYSIFPPNSSSTGTSPSDCLVLYPGYVLVESYSYADLQSVHSTALADWPIIQSRQEDIKCFWSIFSSIKELISLLLPPLKERHYAITRIYVLICCSAGDPQLTYWIFSKYPNSCSCHFIAPTMYVLLFETLILFLQLVTRFTVGRICPFTYT